MNALPPAGWYPDPDVPTGQRYWDGAQWTEHRHDGAVTASATAPAAASSTPTRVFGEGETLLWEGQSQSLTAKATGGKAAAKYLLTTHYLYFEKGMLSTNAQQVPVAALHDIDVRQSMSQKARGVGDVVVHMNRGATMETVTIESISGFRELQRIMNDAAHNARAAIQKAQNTHHYNATGPGVAAQQPAPQQGVSASPVADPMEQLKKLGELRDAGILTPEEFDAKKADILSRM